MTSPEPAPKYPPGYWDRTREEAMAETRALAFDVRPHRCSGDCVDTTRSIAEKLTLGLPLGCRKVGRTELNQPTL